MINFGIYKRRILVMTNHEYKYFNDDGTEINPDLRLKPDLCVTCKKDGMSGIEEILCDLNRMEQQGEEELHCEAYEPKISD
jgi:hypothetical protein